MHWPRKKQNLSDRQPRVGKLAGADGGRQQLVDVGEHVRQARGQDDAAAEAHERADAEGGEAGLLDVELVYFPNILCTMCQLQGSVNI